MVVYKPIPRGEVIDALVHIRDLHRRIEHSNEERIDEIMAPMVEEWLRNLKQKPQKREEQR